MTPNVASHPHIAASVHGHALQAKLVVAAVSLVVVGVAAWWILENYVVLLVPLLVWVAIFFLVSVGDVRDGRNP